MLRRGRGLIHYTFKRVAVFLAQDKAKYLNCFTVMMVAVVVGSETYMIGSLLNFTSLGRAKVLLSRKEPECCIRL